MNTFAKLTLDVPENACETVSGRYVDVVNPQPETISIYDIAWSLSRQARFAGHTMSETVWNVAQHSIFVTGLVEAMFTDPRLTASFCNWARIGDIDSYIFPCDSEISEIKLYALLHDATEAYLVDLPSPVKRHIALRGPYKELESRMEIVIWEGLGLDMPLSETGRKIIHWADLLALQIEAAILMPSRGRGWAGDLPALELWMIGLMPEVLSSRDSFEKFIGLYNKLYATA